MAADEADDAGRVERQVADLFDRLFSPISPFRSLADARGVWHPLVDVYESDRHVLIRIELAGIDTESLEVTKDGQCLIVRGTRVDPLRAKLLTCHQMEISHGTFERVLCLPMPFSEDAVTAEYGRVAGMLEITVEKDVR